MIPDWQLPPGADRGLWDYLHNEPMARSYDERLAGTPLLEIDMAFARHNFIKPGRLIDLGCGTGRLLIPFARSGFECLGVDLSDAMLAVLKEKISRLGLSIASMKANLVELDHIADNTFDYAACLFSTLGMIRGEANRRRFLSHVHRLLKPGGLFVVHVHNRLFRLGRGLGKRGKEKGDRKMPQSYGGAELTLHHFTRSEIESELVRQGFRIRETVPVSTSGMLKRRWWFARWRAYGYLVAAERA